jgi:hypothetical protein
MTAARGTTLGNRIEATTKRLIPILCQLGRFGGICLRSSSAVAVVVVVVVVGTPRRRVCSCSDHDHDHDHDHALRWVISLAAKISDCSRGTHSASFTVRDVTHRETATATATATRGGRAQTTPQSGQTDGEPV